MTNIEYRISNIEYRMMKESPEGFKNNSPGPTRGTGIGLHTHPRTLSDEVSILVTKSEGVKKLNNELRTPNSE